MVNQVHAAGGAPGGYGGYGGGGGGGYAPPPGAPGGYGGPPPGGGGGYGGPPGGGGYGGPPGQPPGGQPPGGQPPGGFGAQPTIPAQAVPTPGGVPTQAGPAKKSSLGLIIGLVVGLLVIGGGAYGAYWFFSGASPVLAKYMPKDTQAYFEIPSATKALVKLAGTDVIDSKEIDTDKENDKAVEGLTNAFDGLKKDDAKALMKSVNGWASGMRKVKDDKQEVGMISFSSADPVEALLKTDRFSKGDKLAGGQGYELKERNVDFDKLKKAGPIESGLSFTQFKGDKKVLVWFADKKILAWGTKDMVEESGKVMTGDKESLASTDKFKSAKFESGSVAVGWVDSDLLNDKDDEKMTDMKKKFFDGVDPFVFSGRVASGGMVLTFTGNLKGKAIPDEKIIPEPGKISLQEKLPATTVAYIAVANGKKIDAKEGKKALVDFVSSLDKDKGKDFDKNIDKLSDVIGVSYETLHDAFGGTMNIPKEEIIAINLTEKFKFGDDIKPEDLPDNGGAELLVRVADKDAAAKVVKALREKVFEDGPAKDMFDVSKKDEGFVATMKSGPAVVVKVDIKDDVAMVLVGGKKRVDEMADAFDGKGDTLKGDKSHKLAMSSLDSKPVMLMWADTGRILKGLMTDDMKDKFKDQGIPYKAFKLDGDGHITSAIAIEGRAKDGGVSYRIETLNIVALVPIGEMASGKIAGVLMGGGLGGRHHGGDDFEPPPSHTDPSSGSGGSGDSTGIQECDDYLAKMETCSVLSSMKPQIPQMRQSFKQAASSGMTDVMKDTCKKGLDAVKQTCP